VQQIGKNVDAGWGEKLQCGKSRCRVCMDNNPVCDGNQLFNIFVMLKNHLLDTVLVQSAEHIPMIE